MHCISRRGAGILRHHATASYRWLWSASHRRSAVTTATDVAAAAADGDAETHGMADLDAMLSAQLCYPFDNNLGDLPNATTTTLTTTAAPAVTVPAESSSSSSSACDGAIVDSTGCTDSPNEATPLARGAAQARDLRNECRDRVRNLLLTLGQSEGVDASRELDVGVATEAGDGSAGAAPSPTRVSLSDALTAMSASRAKSALDKATAEAAASYSKGGSLPRRKRPAPQPTTHFTARANPAFHSATSGGAAPPLSAARARGLEAAVAKVEAECAARFSAVVRDVAMPGFDMGARDGDPTATLEDAYAAAELLGCAAYFHGSPGAEALPLVALAALVRCAARATPPSGRRYRYHCERTASAQCTALAAVVDLDSPALLLDPAVTALVIGLRRRADWLDGYGLARSIIALSCLQRAVHARGRSPPATVDIIGGKDADTEGSADGRPPVGPVRIGAVHRALTTVVDSALRPTLVRTGDPQAAAAAVRVNTRLLDGSLRAAPALGLLRCLATIGQDALRPLAAGQRRRLVEAAAAIVAGRNRAIPATDGPVTAKRGAVTTSAGNAAGAGEAAAGSDWEDVPSQARFEHLRPASGRHAAPQQLQEALRHTAALHVRLQWLELQLALEAQSAVAISVDASGRPVRTGGLVMHHAAQACEVGQRVYTDVDPDDAELRDVAETTALHRPVDPEGTAPAGKARLVNALNGVDQAELRQWTASTGGRG